MLLSPTFKYKQYDKLFLLQNFARYYPIYFDLGFIVSQYLTDTPLAWVHKVLHEPIIDPLERTRFLHSVHAFS